MTPAEYRSIRAGLGLSAQQVATLAGVQARTVQRWENGQDKPRTNDVAEILASFDDRINRTVAGMIGTVADLPEADRPVLLRYSRPEDLPAQWLATVPDMPDIVLSMHCALVERTREEVAAAAGKQLRIVWFDFADYRDWLAGRDDTPDRRNEWTIARSLEESV